MPDLSVLIAARNEKFLLRTIQDVLDQSPLNFLLTTKLMYTFLKKGIIEAKEAELDEPETKDFGQLAHELYE